MTKKYRKTREKIARPTYSFKKPPQNAHPASWRKEGSTIFKPTSKHSVETECRPSLLAEIMLVLGVLIYWRFPANNPQPRLSRSYKVTITSYYNNRVPRVHYLAISNNLCLCLLQSKQCIE